MWLRRAREPDVPAGSTPSRSSTAGAGWRCAHPGVGARLAPRKNSFSWLRVSPLIASRNDILVRRFGDPTNDQRREWLRRLDAYARADGVPLPPRDRLVTRFADREEISVALLGDPGEGDASQYVVVPVLERVASDIDFAVVVSDVIYPAGDMRHYTDRFYQPYTDYPAPIYALPGNHDWYDGLAGFMTAFCEAPPDAGAPKVGGPLLRRLLWRTGAERDREGRRHHARAARRRRPAVRRQPGPYCAIDAGPLRLVPIDTGILGAIDRDQAAWLRAVSKGDPSRRSCSPASRSTPTARSTTRPSAGDRGHRPDRHATPRTTTSRPSAATIHNYQRYAVSRPGRPHDPVPRGGRPAGVHARPPTRSPTSTGCARSPARSSSAATRCAATPSRTSPGATTVCSGSASAVS